MNIASNTFTNYVISSLFDRKCVMLRSIYPSGYIGILPHAESESWIFDVYCIMLSTIAIPVY